MTLQVRGGARVGLLAVLVFVAGGIRAVGSEPKSEGSKDAAAEKQAKADPFVVPEGTPDELLAYIERLQEAKPEGETFGTLKEFRTKQGKALIAAADKIMAAKPTNSQLEGAIAAKVGGLWALKQVGDKEAAKRLDALPDELTKAGHAGLGREVRAFLLQRALMQSRDSGAEELLAQVKKIEAFLKEGPIDASGAQLAFTATRVADMAGDKKVAAGIYRELGALLAKNDDKGVAKLGRQMQGAARRLELVGKKAELEGVTLDGKTVNWSDYRGKVTLVIFWATWCGPCREEIADVRELYETYHGRGFEVLAISIDEDRQQLEAFLKKNPMPWTVVADLVREEKEPEQAMGMRYGIITIPESLLVDREGKVVATGLRGEELGQWLTRLIGPEEAKKGDRSKGKEGSGKADAGKGQE